MSLLTQRKSVRVLFDEYHSESWSISEARAREMQPEYPLNSSYQIAADALAASDFTVHRNLDKALQRDVLGGADVLVLLHPCDPKWERTTSANSPRLSEHEITDIQEFVRAGGGLLVVSEYEHDKYGDNLNDLLAPCGLHLENSSVLDTKANVHNNPAWFFAEPRSGRHATGAFRQARVFLSGRDVHGFGRGTYCVADRYDGRAASRGRD